MKPTEEKIHTDPSDLPIYLFKQGNNCEAYRYFGAHIETRAGESGVVFRVWAPHAAAISVVGDFNSWKPGSHPMHKVDQDSVWELFIPGMKEYDVYKYCVTTRAGDLVYKADPYAFHAETRPSNGSKVYDLNGFAWHDAAWQEAQKKADVINGPMNIYEMHAGSWKLKDEKVPYNYSELADELIPPMDTSAEAVARRKLYAAGLSKSAQDGEEQALPYADWSAEKQAAYQLAQAELTTGQTSAGAVSADLTEVDALSGATITSAAVTNIVNNSYFYVTEVLRAE